MECEVRNQDDQSNERRVTVKRYCLEVKAPFACFTRPEMKVERVSYDVITPSAARSVFEAILWKPAIRWHIRKIEVLNPIRWIALRRNEVSSKASPRSKSIFVEDDRIQRAGLFLRDVRYRLHADLELLCPEPKHEHNFPHLMSIPTCEREVEIEKERNSLPKFMKMFERRASRGQCINQPYLGCREFACDFRLSESNIAVSLNQMTDREKQDLGFEHPRDLGYMLYDLTFPETGKAQQNNNIQPRFFRAIIENGTIDLQKVEVRG